MSGAFKLVCKLKEITNEGRYYTFENHTITLAPLLLRKRQECRSPAALTLVMREQRVHIQCFVTILQCFHSHGCLRNSLLTDRMVTHPVVKWSHVVHRWVRRQERHPVISWTACHRPNTYPSAAVLRRLKGTLFFVCVRVYLLKTRIFPPECVLN